MPPDPREPALPSFLAARAALESIQEAVDTAQAPPPLAKASGRGLTSSEQALSALLLLRELREQLAEWEPGFIEVAREAGARWSDLAHPLGVASRQAAERRYLRLRPGDPGTTGEQRVQSTRDRRAAERVRTSWARGNAAELRRLAGQITTLTDLPAEARRTCDQLTVALADDDASTLLGPLTDACPHLQQGHPDLAARVDSLTHQPGGNGRGGT
ncbi:hypothetical protein N566_20450 [Streptomycetaceae bacterium MP113-05]|nr:hypothetical protein N566_20450 [Streptomycetaceae bacterium MP113-05]